MDNYFNFSPYIYIIIFKTRCNFHKFWAIHKHLKYLSSLVFIRLVHVNIFITEWIVWQLNSRFLISCSNANKKINRKYKDLKEFEVLIQKTFVLSKFDIRKKNINFPLKNLFVSQKTLTVWTWHFFPFHKILFKFVVHNEMFKIFTLI